MFPVAVYSSFDDTTTGWLGVQGKAVEKDYTLKIPIYWYCASAIQLLSLRRFHLGLTLYSSIPLKPVGTCPNSFYPSQTQVSHIYIFLALPI